MDLIHAAVGQDREAIQERLEGILERMTSDWELDTDEPIIPTTHLVADLGFESLDIVQLVVAIQESFHRRDLPFERLLLVDGQYVDDLTVGQVVDFLVDHLAQTASAA